MPRRAPIYGWNRDNCASRAMSSTGLYTGLSAYGTDVVNNATYGLKTNAVRSPFIVNGTCAAPVNLVTNIRYQENTTNLSVYFYAPTTTGCTGNNLVYQWTFPGGTPATYTGTAAPAYVAFATPGIKNVCVKTLCIIGTDTTRTLCCRDINIADPNCGSINPAFSLMMASNGTTYTVATFSNTVGTTYLWTLDGAAAGTSTLATTGVIPQPTVTTTAAGTHTICLTLQRGNVTSGITCERTICKPFALMPTTCMTASARFAATINTTGAPYNAVFNGTLSSSATTYNWTGYAAGAGTSGAALWTATTASPTYNYAAAGTYWACLTINSATACAVKTCMPMAIGSLTCNSVASRSANNDDVASRSANNNDFDPAAINNTQTIISDEVFVSDIALDATAYPNPTNGIVTVQLNRFSQQQNQITITDMQGKTVATQTAEIGQGRAQFDLSAFAAGMYLVTLQAADGTRSVQKIVLSH
jgi:hypothetical protein